MSSDSSLAIDSHSENALAMDYAVGIPRSILLEKYQVNHNQLARILEKPRVASLVLGYQDSIQEAVVRLHHKMAVKSQDILDGIIASAEDEMCPQRFHNSRYIIDKLLPNVSYVATESHHTVDVEVMGNFNKGAKVLEGFVERERVEIKEDDPHLHIGKEVMEERDRGLAGLGKEESS